MPEYQRAPAQRFSFRGMATILPPDRMPDGKYPLAINARAYLGDSLTPRLPQSLNLLSAPLAALIHSLRRMDDTTAPATVPVSAGPNPCGAGTDSPAGGGAQAWANPGNITAPDGSYASVALSGGSSSSSSGPNLPTAAITTGAGVEAWVNPSGIETKNGVYNTAVTLTANDTSQFLQGTGYGFAIPASATITGISATIYRSKSTSGITGVNDSNVQLLKAGIAVGSNRATGTPWATGISTQNYGSSSDLWGTAWTPADINNAAFGLQVSLIQIVPPRTFGSSTDGIDAITITVSYTVPTGSGVSDFLLGTNFGFTISGATTIAGILVQIKGFQTAGGTYAVQLLKGGVPVGAPKTITLPSSNGFVSLGSGFDLWGATWLNTDINATNFGVSMQALNSGTTSTFNIDYVFITISGFVSGGAAAGFVYISGAADKVYVGTTQVASGMSGKRLAMVPFRPNTSVAPWMYIGDSAKLIKVRSDGTTYQQGIKEPQLVPTLSASGAGPITGQIYYAYVYRSSKTGAQSNSSPTSHSQFFTAASNNISVTCTPSVDPQVDLIDVYRFGAGLINFTYVTTILNSAPQFVDNLSDVALANNPILALDNYEPFPSIDIPRTGTLTVSAGTLAGTVNLVYAAGDTFNTRWLGGTVIFISQTGSTQSSGLLLFNRPTDAAHAIAQIQPVGATLPNGNYTFTIYQPILAGQPLPAFWGPTDNAAYMFACGDPLRPGTLYFTKGNNPDAAPQTNSIEITSPAEPLIGGCIVGGLSLVLSSEHGWLIYPNFAQATATVAGVTGSPFSTVMSITDRGLVAKEGICTDGGGTAFFIAKDGIRASVGGVGSSSITDADLYNLFPHEGEVQQPYILAGINISPPDYSQPDGMALRFSQGYLYFDYIGLDNIRHTLTYDASHSSVGSASDNFASNAAWSADFYLVPASIHADNPGMFIAPGPSIPIGPLLGCSDGTIRQLSSTATEPGVNMAIGTPAFDAGEQRANKHWGDLYLETTTPAGVTGNFALTLYSDRYSTLQASQLSPATIPATSGLRVGSVLELFSGLGVYSRDIELVISVPVNSVGSILHLWQPSSILQPETTGERVSDWEDMGVAGTKFIQGIIVEADTANLPKSFAVQSGDNSAVIALAEVGTGIVFNGRSRKAFSVVTPFTAHSVRLYPLDTVPWRVWTMQWVWVPYPELALNWVTELLSHGMEGYAHIGIMNIAHLSTADITLTLIPDEGTPQVIVIPNSGGEQEKVMVTPPAFKWKLLGYQFTSPQPFRLWKEDIEVKVGQWGRTDKYRIVKPFGGQASEGAEV